MALGADMTALLTVWGSVYTHITKAVSYGSSGSPTSTWTSSSTPTLHVQPVSGDILREEQGQKIKTSHTAYGENGITIAVGDRLRPPGWVAGQDEYEVRLVEAWTPSHTRLRLTLVKGHGN